MSAIQRPPRLAWALLRLRPLGHRRPDVEADLADVFTTRVAALGVRHARRRFYADVLSLWWRRLPSAPRVGPSRRARPLQGWWGDLVFAMRLFRKHPVLIVVAAAGLGAGIGVSTSVFSVLNALVLRPLGVADPAGSVKVMRAIATPGSSGVSTGWPYASFVRLRERSTTAVLEAYYGDAVSFGGDGDPLDARLVNLTFVSGSLLSTFGAHPMAGRLLTMADDQPGAPLVAVASYGFWRGALGGDSGVLGRRVRFGGATFTLVGIGERGFTGPMAADTPPACWLPLGTYQTAFGGLSFVPNSPAMVSVAAHVIRGASIPQAERELSAIATELPPVPGGPAASGERITGVQLDPVDDRFSGPAAGALWTIVVIVGVVIGLVLLLACANVTNLLLAGAAARQGEIGLRLALGASRGRIVRQLLTESLVVGGAGGIAGWLLSAWALSVFAHVSHIPAPMDIAPDHRVYLFLTAVSLATAVIAGLAPARRCANADLVSPLKGGPGERDGARRSPARSTLIGLQAASSIMLLVVASLFVRAARHASHVDLGFDPSHLVSVAPAFGREAIDDVARRAYWDEALRRVRAVPGVESAALAEYTPFGDEFGVTTRTRNGQRLAIHTNATQAGYFAVVGLRVLRGRTYTSAEVAAGANVTVISEGLARIFYGTADPIGRAFGDESGGRRVIGVVSDTISADLVSQDKAAEYVPLSASELVDARLLIRTALPPDGMTRSIAAAMESLNPAAPPSPSLVRDRLNEELQWPRVVAAVVSALGAVALGLALMGLYGVTSVVVRQRSREIGVRLAVGATMPSVVRLLVTDAMRPVMIGLGGGLALALGVGRLFAAGLYGLSAHDPTAIASAVAVLVLSAGAAVIVAARRATRVDPVSVLRDA